MHINFNGEILPDDQPILTAGNRAFRYGDGLFESIRAFEGRLPFFHRHWQRLAAGIAFLKFDVPGHFTASFFENEIAKLTARQGNWRIRLTVWRSGGGLYTPETNLPEFLIEATPLPSAHFELNERGPTIGIHPSVRLPTAPSQTLVIPGGNPILSHFKTTSALPYVLAAQHKQANHLDDCLLLNTAGRIACASSANVFLVKNGALHTPPLTEGCVAGTMRAEVIFIAKSLKIKVVEKKIIPTALAAADEVFLTNAVQGVRWVGLVEGGHGGFGNGMGGRLIAELNGRV